MLLWRADRVLVGWLALLTLALGLLPNATVLGTGMLVGAVPEAIRNGLGSVAGHRAVLALLLVSLAFFCSGFGLALARMACELMNTRFAHVVSQTAARACLSPRGIAELESPEIARELDALDEFERSGIQLQMAWSLRIVTSMRIAGIGAAIILLTFAWWAPVVLVSGWYVANRGSSRWMERGFAAVRGGTGDRLRRAEYLRGLATGPEAGKEVRLFGLSSWIGTEYAQAWLEAMSSVWRARRSNVRGLAVSTVAVLASHGAVLAALAWEAANGDLTIGQITVYGLAVRGTGELGFLGDSQYWVARVAALARQLLDLEDRLGGVPSGRGPRSAAAHSASHPGPVEVRLAGVEFTYRTGSRPVLAGLDLHVPPGQSLAVVGENGAGKTTLIKLLCGLYEPDAGQVCLDQKDLRTVDATSEARRIGVIFQNFVRYELSLRDNVGFGSLGLLADQHSLQESLRAAGGADILDDLPDGWDTVLARGYDNGTELSGGQWQKVALARALAAVRGGAGLLVLDEPTANLDIRAEAELFDRFLTLTRGTTTILVSHRLSSVRHADRIVVLAEGRVAEDGTHEQLMKAGGRYATMFRLQAERFDERVREVAGEERTVREANEESNATTSPERFEERAVQGKGGAVDA
ncbi:MAG TPA: ABC transporter ATP-binding protein [Actinopolymorphaceae bacterium]|nr:ABC transporter ATP-binding protein [Actinopolymorphaceae bacterium]